MLKAKSNFFPGALPTELLPYVMASSNLIPIIFLGTTYAIVFCLLYFREVGFEPTTSSFTLALYHWAIPRNVINNLIYLRHPTRDFHPCTIRFYSMEIIEYHRYKLARFLPIPLLWVYQGLGTLGYADQTVHTIASARRLWLSYLQLVNSVFNDSATAVLNIQFFTNGERWTFLISLTSKVASCCPTRRNGFSHLSVNKQFYTIHLERLWWDGPNFIHLLLAVARGFQTKVRSIPCAVW